MKYRLVCALIAATLSACAHAQEKTLTFEVLRSADHIDVRTPGNETLKTIVDRPTIEKALGFIESHRDGWRESWYGPDIPRLVLYFFDHGRKLGGFGLDRERLIVDPTMGVGWVSRPLNENEADRFLNELGLAWPKS